MKTWKKSLFAAGMIMAVSVSSLADQVRVLRKNEDALQARVDSILGATREIQAEYFSVWDDEQSVGGIALLLRAAQSGIDVKVIVDALSSKIPTALVAKMLELGKDKDGTQRLQIKFYNPARLGNLFQVGHRDHAKMLIVDEQRLIIGGRNVGDKYFGENKRRNFIDIDAMIQGGTAKLAKENFLAVWNSQLARAPELNRFSPEKIEESACLLFRGRDNGDQCERERKQAIKELGRQESRIEEIIRKIMIESKNYTAEAVSQRDWFAGARDYKIEFLSQRPEELISEKNNFMSDRLIEIAQTAKKSINVASPYLIPTEKSIKLYEYLLSTTNQDGSAKDPVSISIVTNSMASTDNLFAQAGFASSFKKMASLGIEIHEFKGPDTEHGKAAVIDNQISLIGTFNLDPRSSRINREVGVAIIGYADSDDDFTDNPVATALNQVIEDFKANSILIAKDKTIQNQEAHKELMKSVPRFNRMAMPFLRLLLPLYGHQI